MGIVTSEQFRIYRFSNCESWILNCSGFEMFQGWRILNPGMFRIRYRFRIESWILYRITRHLSKRWPPYFFPILATSDDNVRESNELRDIENPLFALWTICFVSWKTSISGLRSHHVCFWYQSASFDIWLKSALQEWLTVGPITWTSLIYLGCISLFFEQFPGFGNSDCVWRTSMMSSGSLLIWRQSHEEASGTCLAY